MNMLTVGMSLNDDKGCTYILDEIIGHGGFGYVFRAHRENDGVIFAIKTTFPTFGDSASAEAFKNEVRSALKTTGQHIIKYEYVHDGDTFETLPPYIIMEYADGGTLSAVLQDKRIKREQFSNEELIDIFKQLADGMSQVNKNFIHRDIKPDNIFLCGNDLKISDFGLSKLAIESTRTMSFKGGGTPLYMAPEAWDYSKNTIQMDIYSMGIVFFELATLQYPYMPLPTTQDECRDYHLYSSTSNIAKLNNQLSPTIVSVINKMLKKSPKDRFSNWEEIIELLNRNISQESPIDKIVSLAVATKNEEDHMRQKKEAEKKLQAEKKERFIRLIYSQFERDIITPIIEFAEKVNLQYAGTDKLTFPKNRYVRYDVVEFSWKMNIPPKHSLTVRFRVIDNESYAYKQTMRREYYRNSKPQYNGKSILGWGSIINDSGYGFNILLIESGELYGDWIIMNNKNNFSKLTQNERKEPFAFSLDELKTEIYNVQAIHLYSSEFNKFDLNCFMSLINTLSFVLRDSK